MKYPQLTKHNKSIKKKTRCLDSFDRNDGVRSALSSGIVDNRETIKKIRDWKNKLFKNVWSGFGLVLVWFGMVWYGLVWFGLVWSGLVWFCLVWLVWSGLVWLGLVRFVKA